jgi:hypothetical protein
MYRVVEVNPRTTGFQKLYLEVYRKNLFSAVLKVACQEPVGPTPYTMKSSNKVGGVFFVSTYGVGPVSQFFDFENAWSVKDIEILVSPEDEILQESTTGHVLAKFRLVGNSYEEREYSVRN